MSMAEEYGCGRVGHGALSMAGCELCFFQFYSSLLPKMGARRAASDCPFSAGFPSIRRIRSGTVQCQSVFCQGCSPCGYQVGFVGQDQAFRRQAEVFGKGFPQGRDEGQRPSAKQDRGVDFVPVRQCGDCLYCHGAEDGGGNVGPGGVARNQVLDVGLAEHTAPGRRSGILVLRFPPMRPTLPEKHREEWPSGR